MVEEFDGVARGAHVAAQRADGFGKRAHLDVHATVQVEMVHRAAAVFAEDAGGVRVVNHHDAAVFFRQLDQLRQRRDVALHREDAVGDEQLAAIAA